LRRVTTFYQFYQVGSLFHGIALSLITYSGCVFIFLFAVSSISYDLDFDKVDPPPSPGGQGESVTHPPNKFPAVDRSNKPNSWGQTALSAAGTATSAQTNGVRFSGGSNSDSQNSQPPSSGGGVSSHTPPLTSNPTLPTGGPVHAGVPPASVTTPSSIPDVKAAVSNGVVPHLNSAIPSVNRNLKPSAGSQPPVQQVILLFRCWL